MNTYNPPADKLRPPPEKGIGRALLFAALMHVMLILVIALGVHWKSHPPEAVEAELWAPTAHLAAPRPPKVTPQPVPPEVKPQPAPPPPAPPVAKTPPAPDNAEIALEKARRLKQQEEQRQAALLAQQQAEKRLTAKLAAEKLAREQQREQAREEKQRLEQEKIAEQRKQAELQKQQELKAEKQRKAEQQLAKLQQQARSDYMKNLMSQAGTGPSTSTGTAAVSSGPSGKYAARLATLVRQNVIFPQIDQIQGDPKVIITVTLDPNSGEVLGTSIKRSSGVPSWDQAVLRAIQRVGRFPADSNGRWYTPMEIKAGPRDEG
ncbi:cell envelope integrity protein TolA [Thiomonas sp. FB-Cd]|uniref:cell envelope integrity protein TolA n=1 Tax=Thiomonas sp. FB-Cd TaxID=1158292 RepID=UPI0004DF1398|nr:cell envelope integrity protein TolA [Thiomonas sp. FB-Cd]